MCLLLPIASFYHIPVSRSIVRQWLHTCCGAAATHPFGHVCVYFACTGAHAKYTQTCITTYGRRRRPTCTELLPYSLKSRHMCSPPPKREKERDVGPRPHVTLFLSFFSH